MRLKLRHGGYWAFSQGNHLPITAAICGGVKVASVLLHADYLARTVYGSLMADSAYDNAIEVSLQDDAGPAQHRRFPCGPDLG